MTIEFTFGGWVKRRRRALDLTQAQLAGQIGCALGTLRRIEADTLRPSRQIAERLAEAVAVPTTARAAFVAFARDLPLGDAFVLSPEPPVRPAPPSPGLHLASPVTTPLIGRTHTAAAAAQLLLERDVRLVTLLGPPGVGKSRLAFQVASDVADQFADGVAVALLGPLDDPGLVATALAHALALRDDGRSREEALTERVVGRRLLLLIDNMEHLLAAVPLLSRLLQASQTLKLLVTSRIALRLSGEHEFAVPPLALPEQGQSAPDALAQIPAVALFCARARATRADFALDTTNATTIAAICHRLDGIPLALELAAMQLKLLSPAVLLARLDQRLPLLRGGPRDVPARQQTMEAAIAWSYDLLALRRQRLLAILAVFSGGWTLEAAEMIAQLAAPVEDRESTGADLAVLVDHSLVQQSVGRDATLRFTMLESIRAYALARLTASGDERAVRAAHATVFAALVTRAGSGLYGGEQPRWLARLEQEIDNLRGALAWSVSSQGMPDVGLVIAGGLWWFWWASGRMFEGRQWIETLLHHRTADGSSRAVGAMGAGALAFFAGDFAGALPWLDRAIDEGERAGLTLVVTYAQVNRGSIEALTGNPRGEERVVASVERIRSAGAAGAWHLGTAQIVLAIMAAYRGDLAAAEQRGVEALSVFRKLGQPYGIAAALNLLGDVARLRRDWTTAGVFYEASLPLMRESGVRSDLPALLHNLGYVALAAEDAGRAGMLFRESLRIHHDTGNRNGVVECLYGIAAVSVAVGHPERAAQLIAAAAVAAAQLDMPAWAAEQEMRRYYEERVREQLDDEQWRRATALGQAAPPEQLIAEALAMGE